MPYFQGAMLVQGSVMARMFFCVFFDSFGSPRGFLGEKRFFWRWGKIAQEPFLRRMRCFFSHQVRMCTCLKKDDDDDDDVVVALPIVVVILFHLICFCCSSILLTVPIYLYYPLYKGDTCESEMYQTEKWMDSSILPSILAMWVFTRNYSPGK